MTDTINWPAVIKYRGDDELLFINDNNVWENDADLRANTYDESDILIDSRGSVYHFMWSDQQHDVVLKHAGRSMNITEFTRLVRGHLFCMNQCCIAKVELSDYKEGMNLVRETLDD